MLDPMRLTPQILHYNSVGSTNSEVERLALEGAPEGLCVVADEQTAGRGRLQRQWISPLGSGLYFTILLRPQISEAKWPLITLLAAIAVSEVLRNHLAIQPDIKWPNDVLVDDRKISGILAEAFETPTGRALALGIGINLTANAFPRELLDTAISIEEATGRQVEREAILSQLLSSLIYYYGVMNDGPDNQIIDEWCKRSSYANGKAVQIATGGETIRGVTRGLETNGALRVETANGKIQIIHAGDVTRARENIANPSESQ